LQKEKPYCTAIGLASASCKSPQIEEFKPRPVIPLVGKQGPRGYIVVWLASYNEFWRIMSSGDPPLGLQFLAVNSVFLIIVILRRLRRQSTLHSGASHALQISLITVNFMVLMQDGLKPLLPGLPF
jgi:hypothetical protein